VAVVEQTAKGADVDALHSCSMIASLDQAVTLDNLRIRLEMQVDNRQENGHGA
jgi:hypothetical protein